MTFVRLIAFGLLGRTPSVGGADGACLPTGVYPGAVRTTTDSPARVVGAEDGFAIESGNGDFQLQIGLLVHADGRFPLQDDTDQYVDNFAIRRLRPTCAADSFGGSSST